MTELRVRKKGAKTLDVVSDDNPLPISVTETVAPPSLNELLGDILTQLKIQNAHLALVTGERLGETDIEEV